MPEVMRAPQVLRWATVLLLMGRGGQHLLADPPYRAVLWSPDLFGWWPQLWGLTWTDYVNNPNTDVVINVIVSLIGGLYVLAAAMVAVGPQAGRPYRNSLRLAPIGLAILAVCYAADKAWALPELLEYAAQVALPGILLFTDLEDKRLSDNTLHASLAAISLTFSAHAVFAGGWGYAVPGSFQEMVINTLSLSNQDALAFLRTMAWLDVLAVALALLPVTRLWGLAYMLLWGFLTALARPWSHWNWAWPGKVLQTWGPEFLVRTPHFLLPLALLLSVWAVKRAVGEHRKSSA